MHIFPFVVVAWILGVGLYGIVTSRHLVHQIICLIVVQSSTYVLLLGVGYRTGAVAPYFFDVPVHTPAVDEAADRQVPPTSGAVRMVGLLLTGPLVVMGWWLTSHAQTSPSGGFQGGMVLATAFILVYLSGEFIVFKRFSPVDVVDAVEAVGAGGFAAIGLAAVGMGLAYLTNYLPLGQVPGAVSSSGTIALISFFVGLEVAAAFLLIVTELLDQTLLIQREGLWSTSRSSSWPGSWPWACTAS